MPKLFPHHEISINFSKFHFHGLGFINYIDKFIFLFDKYNYIHDKFIWKRCGLSILATMINNREVKIIMYPQQKVACQTHLFVNTLDINVTNSSQITSCKSDRIWFTLHTEEPTLWNSSTIVFTTHYSIVVPDHHTGLSIHNWQGILRIPAVVSTPVLPSYNQAPQTSCSTPCLASHFHVQTRRPLAICICSRSQILRL